MGPINTTTLSKVVPLPRIVGHTFTASSRMPGRLTQNRQNFPWVSLRVSLTLNESQQRSPEGERKQISAARDLQSLNSRCSKSGSDEMKFTELPGGNLGEAISYTLNRWPALMVYLEHPFVEISNNASERSIKPMVLSRRNWLFAGSEEGGQTAATIMSIVETCKRLGINPFEYMKDVLTRLPSATSSQIDDFLPDRWLVLRQTQSQQG